MKNYRKWIWNYVDNLNLEIKTYEKIYVSRQKAKNRKIENNNEVVSIFRKHGYEELSFEDYLFEQVYLMKNCKVMAGVHGAGFANACFLSENTILFELIKEYSSHIEERQATGGYNHKY